MTAAPEQSGISRPSSETVLVVDFGAQYAQLIARRVREARVYSEIVPHTMPVAEMLARRPAAIILSGGPSSVYADGAPSVDPDLFTAGVPTFGICYGFQAMALALGGTVAHTGLAEFGRTPLHVQQRGRAVPRPAGRAVGLDESRRRGVGGTRRASWSRRRPTAPRSRRSRTSRGRWPACSSTPR